MYAGVRLFSTKLLRHNIQLYGTRLHIPCSDANISTLCLFAQQIGKLRKLRKCQCLTADTLGKSHLPECFYNRILAD